MTEGEHFILIAIFAMTFSNWCLTILLGVLKK